ncbi:MAG: hypothetical protein H7Y03_13815 [Chitinophagaceae bacterium]|nr:hypothetical protein [Chitinophagaceae bacterium]
MRLILIAVLLFTSLNISGQRIKVLRQTRPVDTVANGEGIIYGLFIQRLGFASGGFGQDIRLLNLDTKEIFSFRVKPTFKSKKENVFFYHIPSGKYAILNYYWTKSKWYGGEVHTESIYRKSDTISISESGSHDHKDVSYYTFSILPSSLNYVGTWNFASEVVLFSNDKDELDKVLTVTLPLLSFKNAVITIPN